MPVEQEIKLVFADVEAARQAVQTAGGRLVVSRRLLDDTLFDTPDGAHIAIDEPPFAVFVEVEGSPEIIARTAARLGRTADDYRLESYATLWRRWCEANGITPRDMLFEPPPSS